MPQQSQALWAKPIKEISDNAASNSAPAREDHPFILPGEEAGFELAASQSEQMERTLEAGEGAQPPALDKGKDC